MFEVHAVFLHFGGASTASVVVVVVTVFFLMFALSFAFGSVPEGKRRFSREWAQAWSRASLPRLAVSALFAGALFTASALSGGGAETNPGFTVCGAGVPPLTTKTVTAARLQSGIDGMRRLRDAAERGDLATARSIIVSDAHSVTHDIDAPLRRQEPQLARQLCESVVGLETEVGRAADHSAIARAAESTIGLLERAGHTLGLPLSVPPRTDSGPCDRALAPATDMSVTGIRLSRAVEDMLRVADAAASGDTGLASEIFFGDAHDVTHDIDGALRGADPDLALGLCQNILTIESQLAGQADLPSVAAAAEAAAGQMLEAGRALGLLR